MAYWQLHCSMFARLCLCVSSPQTGKRYPNAMGMASWGNLKSINDAVRPISGRERVR